MKEIELEKEIIFEGKILRVEKDKVQLEDGSISYREIAINNGGVSVLALTEKEEVILVKQFRYPSKEELYEIPGGRQEKDETFVQSGMRELQEETGYVSEDVSYFGYFYPTVAYATETIHIVLAKNCVYKRQMLDEGEFVEVYKIPFDKAMEMVFNNEIKDGKTVIALLKYNALRKRG